MNKEASAPLVSATPADPVEPMRRLLEIMRQLRDPVAGCPWDREQNFSSIVPHTLEEAYEVAEAVHNSDSQALRAELGDLLFQVVFLSQLASEAGWFNFDDVAQSISQNWCVGTRMFLARQKPHRPPSKRVYGRPSKLMSAPPRARLGCWQEWRSRSRH